MQAICCHANGHQHPTCMPGPGPPSAAICALARAAASASMPAAAPSGPTFAADQDSAASSPAASTSCSRLVPV